MQCNLELKKIMNSFQDINLFMYAAYRTALKMRRLQKACKLHLVDLKAISCMFSNNGYHTGNTKIIQWQEADILLRSLYDTVKGQFGFSEEPTMLSSLFLSFLTYTANGNLNDGLHISHLNIALAIFSNAKLSDKYRYIFQQLEFNGAITRKRLYFFVDILAKIAEALGEKLTFGTKFVQAAVKSCIQFAHDQEKIPERSFLDWLACEPQTLVWLSTHYRLCVSESVEHPVRCNICKARPICGLRYKCLACFGYNLCQQCFLRGFTSHGHQSKHLVREYCRMATSWDEFKTTLLAIKNSIVCGGWKQIFLEIDSDSNDSRISKLSDDISFVDENVTNSSNCTTAIQELAAMIEELENEKRQVSLELVRLDERSKNSNTWKSFFNSDCCLQKWILLKKALQNHEYCLKLQLEKLRNLSALLEKKETSSSIGIEKATFTGACSGIPDKEYFESTPLAAINKNPLLSNLPNLSRFIKLHSDFDGLKSLSGMVPSIGNGRALYSMADIEMDCFSPSTSVPCSLKQGESPFLEDCNKIKRHFDNKNLHLMSPESYRSLPIKNSKGQLFSNNSLSYNGICMLKNSLDSLSAQPNSTSHSSNFEEASHSSGFEETSHSSGFEETSHSSKSDEPAHNSKSDEVPHNSKSDEVPHNSKSNEALHSLMSRQELHNTRPEAALHNSRPTEVLHNSRSDGSSLEFVETEMKMILKHLESISPKVTDLQNSLPLKKDIFSSLIEMEAALKMLSSTISDKEVQEEQ